MQTVGNEPSGTALVRRFFDLVNSDKFDEASDLLTENVFYHNVPLPELCQGRDMYSAKRHIRFVVQAADRAWRPACSPWPVAFCQQCVTPSRWETTKSGEVQSIRRRSQYVHPA